MRRVLATLALLALAGCVLDADARPERARGRRGEEVFAAAAAFSSSLSVLFDGVNENLTVTDDAALTCATQLTVSLWSRASAQAGGDMLCGKAAAATPREWSVEQGGAVDEYHTIIGASATNYGRTTDANAAIGTYQHVCFQFNGAGALNADRLKVWVDGTQRTLIFSGTIPASISDSAANLTCGRSSDGARAFNGYVDEVFVRCALVSCVTLYNAGKPGDLSALNPLVWYRMGEGATFPTIPNAVSPGTYDGTMTNGESGDIQAVVP